MVYLELTMSEEMAVGDKTPSEESKVGGDESETEPTDVAAASETPSETATPEPQQFSAPVEGILTFT